MHLISYGSVEEKLFLLEQIAHGSYSTAKKIHDSFYVSNGSEVNQVELEMELLGHQDFVRYFAGDYLIECATKTRILQDATNFKIDNGEEGVYCPDAEAFQRFPGAARLCLGDVKLSLRECCNKVIHAERLEFGFFESPSEGFAYWNGKCGLFGHLGKKPWEVELDVKEWVLAMRHYYSVIAHL